MRPRTALIVFGVMLASGCGPAPAPVVPSVDAVASVEGAAADHARWVLTHALGAGPLGPEDLAARFTGPLVEDGGTGLLTTIDTVRADGPWQAVDARASGSGHSVDVVLRSSRGTHLAMHVTVGDDGRAVLFWFGSAVDRGVDVSTAVGRRQVLDALPARSALSVGTVEGQRCADLRYEGSDAGAALPLASVAKLLVVHAVLDRVAAGGLQWDSVLTLDESRRSLPAGELAVAPAGTTITVQEAVLAALLESDNTAADLLLDAVGVEQVQALYAELQGGAVHPFWSTREVFALGWGPMAVPGQVHADPADVAERRATIAVEPLATSVLEVTVPRWQDGLDWFLPAAGLCELGARLYERWPALPAAVRAAVADGDVLLEKLGGAPGVVTGLWLVEGADGPVVVTTQYASEVATAVGDAAGLLSVGEALVAEATG